MSSDLVRRLSPEEEELEKKQAELAALETELAQRELDLTNLHAELHTFEQKYQQIIGTRFAELDHIEAQISEYMAYLESFKDFKPSATLKQLYREVAKKIHPDLATNEADKGRRQEFMALVNQAYEDGNEDKLREILHQWEISPESIQGDAIGDKLIRVLRQIAQVRDRLQNIEQEMNDVQQTELYQLKAQVITLEQSGRDLLAEMASQLEQQITAAQQKLTELKAKLGLNR